jgi:hypothetical protein
MINPTILSEQLKQMKIHSLSNRHVSPEAPRTVTETNGLGDQRNPVGDERGSDAADLSSRMGQVQMGPPNEGREQTSRQHMNQNRKQNALQKARETREQRRTYESGMPHISQTGIRPEDAPGSIASHSAYHSGASDIAVASSKSAFDVPIKATHTPGKLNVQAPYPPGVQAADGLNMGKGRSFGSSMEPHREASAADRAPSHGLSEHTRSVPNSSEQPNSPSFMPHSGGPPSGGGHREEEPRSPSSSSHPRYRVAPLMDEKLTWRADPRQSHSDLEIKVVRKDSGKTDLYKVHSRVLTDGPRSSKFFREFVKQANRKPTTSPMLCLELPDMSANAFPALLDYVYGTDRVPSVKRKSEAFAAYDLAQHLEMPLLMEAVAEWFRPMVKLARVGDFLGQVEKFKENAGPLISVAVELCARNFDGLGAEVGGQLGADVLVLVLERVWETNYVFNLRTDYVADIVLECASEGKMDAETFYKLTDRRFLPVLEPRSALKLLIVDDDFNDCDRDNRHLSCLQRRCVRSLIHHWKSLCKEFESPDTMTDVLACLSSPVLSAILVGISRF